MDQALFFCVQWVKRSQTSSSSPPHFLSLLQQINHFSLSNLLFLLIRFRLKRWHSPFFFGRLRRSPVNYWLFFWSHDAKWETCLLGLDLHRFYSSSFLHVMMDLNYKRWNCLHFLLLFSPVVWMLGDPLWTWHQFPAEGTGIPFPHLLLGIEPSHGGIVCICLPSSHACLDALATASTSLWARDRAISNWEHGGRRGWNTWDPTVILWPLPPHHHHYHHHQYP